MKRALFSGILLVMILIAGCAGSRTEGSPPDGGVVVSPVPSPGAPGLSKSDPAPVNVTVEFREAVNDSGQGTVDHMVRLTLVETLRGDAAMDKMKRDVPFYIISIPSDREYLLARFKYELADTGRPGVSRLVDRGPFELYRDGGASPDDNEQILGPLPDFYARLRPGEAVDGWIAFTVPKDAPGPLIVYGRSGAGAGIWFKTG